MFELILGLKNRFLISIKVAPCTQACRLLLLLLLAFRV
jgi:hypothetical protein